MKQGNISAECCVCSLNKSTSNNLILTCSGHGCQVSVHQNCYGVLIAPKKPWFCRRCESQERAARVKCDLCPNKEGALKRTDSGGWCHVVCALYIPEVTFGCSNAMEPIILKSIPAERFNKICHICDENCRDARVTIGACMPCNRHGCKLYFHVTCGQSLGLLREEPKGNGPSGPITYIGYCKTHINNLLPKQKKDARHFGSRSSSNSSVHPPPSSTPRPIPTPSPSLAVSTPINNTLIDTTLQNGIVFNPVQLRASGEDSPQSTGNMGSKFTTANFVEATFESPPAAFNPPTSSTHQDAIPLSQFSSTSNFRSSVDEISSINTNQVKTGKKSPRSDKRTNIKSKFNNLEETLPKKAKIEEVSNMTMSNFNQPPNYKHMNGTTNSQYTSLHERNQIEINPHVFEKRDTFSNSCQSSIQDVKALEDSFPTTIEELLDKQWNLGFQFFVEQGEHFDVSSLLTSLDKMRQENKRLESYVEELTSRRDRLLLINSKLSAEILPHAAAAANSEIDHSKSMPNPAVNGITDHVRMVNQSDAQPQLAMPSHLSFPIMPFAQPTFETAHAEISNPIFNQRGVRTQFSPQTFVYPAISRREEGELHQNHPHGQGMYSQASSNRYMNGHHSQDPR